MADQAGAKRGGVLELEGGSPRPLPVLSRQSFISRTIELTEVERSLIRQKSVKKKTHSRQSPESDSDADGTHSPTVRSSRSTPSQSPRSPHAPPGWKDSLRGVTPSTGAQPNVTSKSPRFASMIPAHSTSPRVKNGTSVDLGTAAFRGGGATKRYPDAPPKSPNSPLSSSGKGSRTPPGKTTASQPPLRKEKSAPHALGVPTRRKQGGQSASPLSRSTENMPGTEISFSDFRTSLDELGGPAVAGEESFSSADGEPMVVLQGPPRNSGGARTLVDSQGSILGRGAQRKGGTKPLANGRASLSHAKNAQAEETRRKGDKPQVPGGSTSQRAGSEERENSAERPSSAGEGSPSSRLLRVSGDDVTVEDEGSGRLSPDKLQRMARDLVGPRHGRASATEAALSGELETGVRGWSGPLRLDDDVSGGSNSPSGGPHWKESLRKSKSVPRFDYSKEAHASSGDYSADVSLDGADESGESERRTGIHRANGAGVDGPGVNGPPASGAAIAEAFGGEERGNRDRRRGHMGSDISVMSGSEDGAVSGRYSDVDTGPSTDSERDNSGRRFSGWETRADPGRGDGVRENERRWTKGAGVDERQKEAWEGACKREELQGLRLKEVLAYKAQMKEKFSRLLLGDDVSGGSRGVCPAVAISNAVTLLSVTVFGDVFTLEPLDIEKKLLWTREIDWLISPAYHIVEMRPGWLVTPAGEKTEIMQRLPRGDLQASLPVLKKLDALLIDTMDTLVAHEFSYKSAPRTAAAADMLDAYWRPKAVVPPGGLSPEALRKLKGQKEVVTNIYAVAMAINAQTLAEMAIPDEYWESLPKSSKAALGEDLYRALTEESFEIDVTMSALGITDEESAARAASDLEAAIHLWQRKLVRRGQEDHAHEQLKSLRQRVETMAGHGAEARERWVARASELLHTLFATFPGLPHTRLAQAKIDHNKDVGQAVLEAYSRVLESVASNLLAGISHVLESHEEAYSLGKALRASSDYGPGQHSPTSLLINPAPTPPKTPGDSGRSSDPGDMEKGDVHGGGRNAPAGNPLQQWVVLEGRSSQSAQDLGKVMDDLRSASGRFD